MVVRTDAARLPRETLRVWRIRAGVRAIVIVGVLTAAALTWQRDATWMLLWVILGAAKVAHMVVELVWLLPRRFTSYRYQAGAGGFMLSSHRLVTRRLIIPAGQILFVEVQQGPVSRMMGLKTVRIGTLGSTHDVGPLLGHDADDLAAELLRWSRDGSGESER